MDLKKLPSGRNFRVSAGANNFTKKLNQATRFGDLKNLRDNKDSILKALKPVERIIRLGKFGRLSQLSVMAKIKKLEGYNLTKQDKSDIKKVFAQLTGKKSSQSTSSRPVSKQLDETSYQGEDVLSRRQNTMSTRLSSGRVKPIYRDPNNEISYNGIRIQADKVPSRVIRSQSVTSDNKSSTNERIGLLKGKPGGSMPLKLY